MRAQRLVILILVGLLAFDAAPVRACPLQQSLWSLMRGSELIALVSVEAFEQGEALSSGSKPDGIERNVAVLRILTTYKGALRGEVRVNFSEALYAGDHQVAPGDELLVFLE